VVNATPRPLYPPPGGKRRDTHCRGSWVGPRAGLHGRGKSRLHRDSIPGPSSQQRVAIPTEPSRPTLVINKTTEVHKNKKQYRATATAVTKVYKGVAVTVMLLSCPALNNKTSGHCTYRSSASPCRRACWGYWKLGD
jgi:hypothetical protein